MVFLPGAGNQVQREIGQQFFEHGVLRLVIAQAMLHEVQVIIHKQGREIRPQQQAVALPHEDGFYLGEFLNWFLFCFSHSVALCILL